MLKDRAAAKPVKRNRKVQPPKKDSAADDIVHLPQPESVTSPNRSTGLKPYSGSSRKKVSTVNQTFR